MNLGGQEAEVDSGPRQQQQLSAAASAEVAEKEKAGAWLPLTVTLLFCRVAQQ